jgi:hypothetical protein
MAEGRGRQSWAHTSAVLALIANVNRDPKKTRAFKPSDFDPYSAKDKRDAAIEVKDMTVLRDVFKPKSERTP